MIGKNIIRFWTIGIICLAGARVHAQKTSSHLPKTFEPYIKELNFGVLGHQKAFVTFHLISKHLLYVNARWRLQEAVSQNDLQIDIRPAFNPTFNWAPHLTPTDDHIIAQHVFRTPAMIVASSSKQLAIIPDVGLLMKGAPVDWYMDMDATKNILTIGMSNSEVREHVLFVRKPGAVFPKGDISCGFYLRIEDDSASLSDPWRSILNFYWTRWGEPLYHAGAPLYQKDLAPYVQQTYDWAFKNWKKSVWQEFSLGGKIVGAPVFIVNVTQSPDYKGMPNEREFTSIWNQAWFSSLRSAEGLYRYAKRKKDTTLLSYALKTKDLALLFPQTNGFFFGIIATEMKKVTIDGQSYNRSKGWDHYYFGNSNRNPYSNDPKLSPYHVLDMSYTAYLMLTWYDELEKDHRLLNYAIRYADALLKIQRSDGFFPGWVSLKSFKPLDALNVSPESSMSVTFLLKLYKITKNERYLYAALRCMDAIVQQIIPIGRWEDFETYWSCSRYGSNDLVGKKVERNNMFKQNNLSMYYTAQALYYCYQVTGKQKYLQFGQRTLDELLMTQASWQPPYMYVNVLGGFGVMNGDGEWDDARESLFSELIIDYGKLLHKKAYIQRGIAALRASFVMMYTPLNPKTQKQWELKWPFFGKKDYGFMMENYGHGGQTSPDGLGIGEFTIFDWGNGAAAEVYNRIVDHYGVSFISNY